VFLEPLVPADFEIPPLRTDRYRLEPLNNRWVLQDFAAITETFPHMEGLILPPGSLPVPGTYTLETNALELAWHEREYNTRRSFGFAAITHDDRREVGCMYLYPSFRREDDAVGCSWARWDPDDPDADKRFFEEFRCWVEERWPFERVAYPGRSISWEDWLSTARYVARA
jgi:hypothetical protein